MGYWDFFNEWACLFSFASLLLWWNQDDNQAEGGKPASDLHFHITAHHLGKSGQALKKVSETESEVEIMEEQLAALLSGLTSATTKSQKGSLGQ